MSLRDLLAQVKVKVGEAKAADATALSAWFEVGQGANEAVAKHDMAAADVAIKVGCSVGELSKARKIAREYGTVAKARKACKDADLFPSVRNAYSLLGSGESAEREFDAERFARRLVDLTDDQFAAVVAAARKLRRAGK